MTRPTRVARRGHRRSRARRPARPRPDSARRTGSLCPRDGLEHRRPVRHGEDAARVGRLRVSVRSTSLPPIPSAGPGGHRPGARHPLSVRPRAAGAAVGTSRRLASVALRDAPARFRHGCCGGRRSTTLRNSAPDAGPPCGRRRGSGTTRRHGGGDRGGCPQPDATASREQTSRCAADGRGGEAGQRP